MSARLTDARAAHLTSALAQALSQQAANTNTPDETAHLLRLARQCDELCVLADARIAMARKEGAAA